MPCCLLLQQSRCAPCADLRATAHARVPREDAALLPLEVHVGCDQQADPPPEPLLPAPTGANLQRLTAPLSDQSAVAMHSPVARLQVLRQQIPVTDKQTYVKQARCWRVGLEPYQEHRFIEPQARSL